MSESNSEPASRYAEEKAKRLLNRGGSQFRAVTGDLSGFASDPWVTVQRSAPSRNEMVDVVIVGGGFGGLVLGARLKEQGFEKILIVDSGADFGGTWYWNRYPGAACDVESYIYLPLLEEVGGMPSQKYASADEIRRHCRRLADRYCLHENALFQTTVTGASWDDGTSSWTVRTDCDDEIIAKFVVLSTGPLNRPKLPGIDGIEDFSGRMFHTARWDYSYTGGSSSGALDGLFDKSVALIGTGATAVQCVPHLADSSKQLFVFQRTPSPVDSRNNRPTDTDWFKGLSPGWQKDRMENFTALMAGMQVTEDLVSDGWTEAIRAVVGKAMASAVDVADFKKRRQLADFEKMDQIRARVDELVIDTKVREALKPWYNQFCKRPCFHDTYLQAFNRNNVELIDVGAHPIERIDETGIWHGDRHFDVDCIIFATGFDAASGFRDRVGFDVVGLDSISLDTKWAEGVATLHGMYSNGFPNLFFLNGMQSAISINFAHMIVEQSGHIAYVIARMRENQLSRFEVLQEAETEWCDIIERDAAARREFLSGCTPGYYNNEGRLDDVPIRNGFYPDGPMKYIELLDAWRVDGTMHGLMVA